MLKEKMHGLMQTCECGSGKQAWQCCKKGEAMEIGDEKCPCDSGKMVKDCCMANPEAHHDM